MLDQQFFVGALQNRAGNSLPMLRSQNQGTQDEEIQGTLQQFQAVARLLGRHLT